MLVLPEPFACWADPGSWGAWRPLHAALPPLDQLTTGTGQLSSPRLERVEPAEVLHCDQQHRDHDQCQRGQCDQCVDGSGRHCVALVVACCEGVLYQTPRPPSSLTVSVGVVPVVEPARSVASRLRLVGFHTVGLVGLALCNASLVGVPSFASSFPVLCACHCVLSVVLVSVYCTRWLAGCQA